MKQKIKNKKVINVDDWDDFVSEVYGRPYNFQQQDGCKDRGFFHFCVPYNFEPEDYEDDTVPDPVPEKAYMVNVASYRNGVGYGKWTHLDGWSDNLVAYIQAIEEAK